RTLRPEIDPLGYAPGPRVHGCDSPVGITLAPGKSDIELSAVRSEGERPWLAAKRLRTIRPELVTTLYDRVIGVDPGARIGASIDVTGAKHDLGIAVHATAFAGWLRSDNVFHRVTGNPGDDFTL